MADIKSSRAEESQAGSQENEFISLAARLAFAVRWRTAWSARGADRMLPATAGSCRVSASCILRVRRGLARTPVGFGQRPNGAL